jgi:hypothetical protein
MYIKIKKAVLVPDQFGHHIRISMIGLYENDGKFIRWVKLNDKVIEELCNHNLLLDTTN